VCGTYPSAYPPELRWQILTPLLLITLVLGWGFQLGKCPLSPPELVGLELARTLDRAKGVVKSGPELGSSAPHLIGVGLDYLFLIAYSNAIACGCIWYAGEFNWSSMFPTDAQVKRDS